MHRFVAFSRFRWRAAPTGRVASRSPLPVLLLGPARVLPPNTLFSMQRHPLVTLPDDRVLLQRTLTSAGLDRSPGNAVLRAVTGVGRGAAASPSEPAAPASVTGRAGNRRPAHVEPGAGLQYELTVVGARLKLPAW